MIFLLSYFSNSNNNNVYSDGDDNSGQIKFCKAVING